MNTCRSCGAEIVWVVSTNGRPTPADAKLIRVLVPTGKLVETDHGSAQEVEVRTGYVSHFATCPYAKEHQYRKGKQ